jgi:hypothetical protein
MTSGPEIIRIPKKSNNLYYSTRDALKCQKVGDVITWLLEQCSLQIKALLEANEISIPENVEASEPAEDEDYEEEEDDFREPALTFQPGSKSEVAFVERKQLLQLLHYMSPKQCPLSNCHEEVVNIEVNDWSMTYSVQFVCGSNHRIPWLGAASNSHQSVPDVKPLAFHRALSSGLTYTGFAEFFFAIGFSVPKKSSFYKFQRGSRGKKRWLDIAVGMYKDRQKTLLDGLWSKSEPILAYIDARYDSSRNAAHGTIAVMNAETGEVIEVIIKTREKLGDAWRMEDSGTKEAIRNLEATGIQIAEVVHDDIGSVDVILAEHNIISQKDLWHKCKILNRKFGKELLKAKIMIAPETEPIGHCTSSTQVRKYNNKSLKYWLRSRGVSMAGNKEDLVKKVATVLNFIHEDLDTSTKTSRTSWKYPEHDHNIG